MADRIVKHLQAFGAALQLLSRIPVPADIPFTPQMLARSTIYYPAAGLIIGSLAAGAGFLLGHVLPPLIAAVLLLMVWTALSGALHLDGLMDTADGVLSHRSRERMLEIMKDSRVGAMGVIAAVLILLLKFALLYEALGSRGWQSSWYWLALACVWSRCWMAGAIAWWPLARKGEGMGALLSGTKGRHAAGAICMACALSMGLLAFYYPLWQQLVLSVGMLLLAGAAGTLAAIWLTRKLGGLTGDTYGAMNEMIECVLLLAVSAWLLQ